MTKQPTIIAHGITDLIDIKDADLTAEGLIYSTWLQGYLHGNAWNKWLNKPNYYSKQRSKITTILSRPQTRVKIACLKEDHDTIIGYSVIEDNILHWIHVREAWRKLGVAKLLVTDNINTVTHLNIVGEAILPHKWKYDPFLA